MLVRVHAIAATIAFLTVLTFWISTVLAEAFMPAAAIVAVKRGVLWGLLILVPALMVTGATGFRLGQRRKDALTRAKRLRMPVIAAGGVLVLIPAAVYLAVNAEAGRFDTSFAVVQGLELLAGGINLWLMSLNIRDGRKLSLAGRSRAA